MTRLPITIGVDQSLASARELMDRYSIRHLPVLELGRLVGIVSERELDLLLTAPEVDPHGASVRRAMRKDVLTVSPEDPLGDVAEQMHERKAGSAIVCRGGDVVGVFTTTDALRVLA
jgi:acetoin utilization protein AcuB